MDRSAKHRYESEGKLEVSSEKPRNVPLKSEAATANQAPEFGMRRGENQQSYETGFTRPLIQAQEELQEMLEQRQNVSFAVTSSKASHDLRRSS